MLTHLKNTTAIALLRAFCRDESGTALEFGLLAIPFFALIGAILQTAMIFLASQIFDGAVQDSSRLILTGQAQTAGYTASDFQNAICKRLFGMFDCSSSRMLVTVSIVANFASATASASPLDPIDPSKWKLTPTYQPGLGSQVIMVRAYYNWPVIFSFDGLNLQTSADGTYLISSARVFQNEPFT